MLHVVDAAGGGRSDVSPDWWWSCDHPAAAVDDAGRQPHSQCRFYCWRSHADGPFAAEWNFHVGHSSQRSSRDVPDGKQKYRCSSNGPSSVSLSPNFSLRKSSFRRFFFGWNFSLICGLLGCVIGRFGCCSLAVTRSVSYFVIWLGRCSLCVAGFQFSRFSFHLIFSFGEKKNNF